MPGETDGPNFEWLVKAILFLERPFASREDEIIRHALTRDMEIQTSTLSANDKRRLAEMVLREGARQSVDEGVEERTRHARLSKRLIALGLMPPPREIMALHMLSSPSPLSRIWYYFNAHDCDWRDEARDPRKAYMLACLSEIAYLYLTDRELEQDSRLRLFIPSRAGRLLHRHHARLTLEALGRTADLGEIRILQSARFAYFVVRMRDMAVIAVRGTVMTDWRDWFADLDAFKVAAPQGFYHRGFFDEANDKLAELVDAVGDAAPLYITGHSLGAAMASILCSIWNGPAKPMKPYLFSSPRFGTPSVAKRLPRYAYMKQGDLVPDLPPKWMGYSDEGAETRVFSNCAPPGSRWQDDLWFRQKLRAHSIEQMRVTLASEVEDTEFDAGCYTSQIAAEIKKIQAQSDALKAKK